MHSYVWYKVAGTLTLNLQEPFSRRVARALDETNR